MTTYSDLLRAALAKEKGLVYDQNAVTAVAPGRVYDSNRGQLGADSNVVRQALEKERSAQPGAPIQPAGEPVVVREFWSPTDVSTRRPAEAPIEPIQPASSQPTVVREYWSPVDETSPALRERQQLEAQAEEDKKAANAKRNGGVMGMIGKIAGGLF